MNQFFPGSTEPLPLVFRARESAECLRLHASENVWSFPRWIISVDYHIAERGVFIQGL